MTRQALGVDGQPERRTQQQRRLTTESRVLDAATRLIASRGSRAISLAEVGRLAGYSSGIVSHHFGSKQQLLTAVIRQAQHFEVPTTEGRGLDQVSALAVAYLRNLRDRAPSGQAFLLLWSEAAAGEAALISIFAERDAWFRALIVDLLRQGVDDGSIRADVPAEGMAVTITGMLRGIGIQLMLSSTNLPDDHAIGQAVELLLRGLDG